MKGDGKIYIMFIAINNTVDFEKEVSRTRLAVLQSKEFSFVNDYRL